MPSSSASPATRPAGGCREVASLALPLVFSLLSQTLMASLESALLGHVGAVEQGAMGLAWAFLWPLHLGCNWSGVGVQICVAQAVGAQHREACRPLAWQGLYLSVLAWVVLALAGIVAPVLVPLSAPSPDLLAPTILYLRIALLGSLPGLLNLTLVGFFRGLGDVRTPLLVTLVVEILNAGLAVLLIFGLVGFPRLGVAGAASASVGAAVVGTGLYLYCFLRRGAPSGDATERWPAVHWATCRRIIRVGWPIGAQTTLEMGAWSVFTAFIARLGSIEAAAHSIALRVIALTYMTGYGIAVAATTLVGQYHGAQNAVATRRTMRSSLLLVLGLMGSLGLGLAIWRRPLVQVFTNDPAVATLAVPLMLCVALFQLCDSVSLGAMGVLRGVGQTRWPLLVGLVSNWGLFIPGAVLVLVVWPGGLLGGWIMALGATMVFGLVLLWRVLWRPW